MPALPQGCRGKRPLALVELAIQEDLQHEVKELKKHLQKRKKIGKQKSVLAETESRRGLTPGQEFVAFFFTANPQRP